VKINVILADAGTQDPTGKLNLLGVGWSVTAVGPNGLTADSAVAVFLEVPWDKANRELEVVLQLFDDDRSPFLLPTPAGAQPLRIAQKVVVPIASGAPNGSSGIANLLAQFQGGLPLSPGNWYCWRVTVDDESNDAWTARFFVRRQPSMPSFGTGGPTSPMVDS
jgi:hypothetical protein